MCRGIGATKGGVIESRAHEETLMDLFAEQALWTFTEADSVLRSLRCSDEVLVRERWLRKEPAEVFEKCASYGQVIIEKLMQ